MELRAGSGADDVAAGLFQKRELLRAGVDRGLWARLDIGGRGMNLLLSELLPLRTTRELGDYSVDAPLPHRLGDFRKARFKLLRKRELFLLPPL